MDITKEELLSIAIGCIENQETGECKKMNCARCPYNVSLYTKDHRVALSLLAQAKKIWPNTNRGRDHQIMQVLKVVLIIGLLLFAAVWAHGLEFCGFYIDEKAAEYDKVRAAGGMPTIDMAIAKMRNNLRDVDGNDDYDCVDYATIFYEYMPGSFLLYINNRTFVHLFVGILRKPVDYSSNYWVHYLEWVEPQLGQESYHPDRMWYWSSDWDSSKVVHRDKWYQWATNMQWEWTDSTKTKWRWKK